MALIAVATASLVAASPVAAAPRHVAHTVTVVLKPTTGVHPTVDSKSWSLASDAHSGDCTMFAGATWTLQRTMKFGWRATITSSDNNDYFQMRMDPEDANHAVIGRIGYDPDPNDTTYAYYMPDHSQQYQWVDPQLSTAYLNSWLGYDDFQFLTVHLTC
jgi:hypothetical protein